MAERQVLFYACEDIEKRPPFSGTAAVTGLAGLEDSQWRMPDKGLASDLAVLVDQEGTETKPSHLRFLRIREDAPFKLSAARQLAPVEVAENEAIAEFTWVVLWPDHYLAAVNARDAPTHKKIGAYFNYTSGEQTHIVSLLSPDVLKRLKEMRKNGKLRSLQVSVRMSELEKIAAAKTLPGFGSLIAAGKEADALVLDIRLGIGRGHRESRLNDATAQSAEELAGFVEVLESMHVSGYDKDGNKQDINLKQERIGGPIQIEASTSNAQVYAAIERTRKEVEKDIGSLENAARGS